MNDVERYSCQLSLNEFGPKAQQKLRNSRVLIAGAGGLGCPASLYLVSMGIGTLGIADFDRVSQSNLHRQVLYGKSDVGKLKTSCAAKYLKRQNPNVAVVEHTRKITANNVMELIEGYDIVVDCTDNFCARYMLNDACVIAGKPLVYGAIFQYEGQAAIWNVKNTDGTMSANYRDTFPFADEKQTPNCAEGGVIPTIAGIIGCIQANETVKYLIGAGDLLSSKLLVFDAKTMHSYVAKLPHSTETSIKYLPNTATVPQISTGKLKSVIDKKIYEVIDVRSPKEHSAKNIGGKNIPLDNLEKLVKEIDFSKPVVFYCNSGERSSIAVKRIGSIRPNSSAMSLKGGISTW